MFVGFLRAPSHPGFLSNLLAGIGQMLLTRRNLNERFVFIIKLGHY